MLVLVEPTWFTGGAPADPLAWLSSLGVRWDLALVALEDPAASGVERLAATSFVEAARVPFIEAAE